MDPLTPARSWLFVPATRPDRFAKAAASGADRVILDLEDAVAPEAKRGARETLASAPLPAGVPLYVRVNGHGTDELEEDLAVAARLPVAGIVLPKAERAEHLARVAAAVTADRSIVPIVETALGLFNAVDLARAARVERLAFGAIDFQVDTGVRGDDAELAHARSHLVLVSRVAGIGAPIDSVSTATGDEAATTRDAARAFRFGFAGKLCIHPAQVAPTNRAFLPSAEELEWAEGLLAAMASLAADERGVFSYRGAMVDRPVVERARRILSLAGRDGRDRPPGS
jgi:citrate lyase subunit beta / citryl-CoA lyase